MAGAVFPVRASVAGHPLVAEVDRMIEVHDQWENDDTAPNVPTAAFEAQIHQLARVADQDVPNELIELHSGVARLVHEWNEYASGEKRVHGRPLPVFWAAFRGMLEARRNLCDKPRRILEPVKVLLSQGVGYNQIAQHIYGHNGQGPLLNEYGQPDVAKIHQEADKPGSVIPKGWLHPADAATVQHTVTQFASRIQAVTDRENDDIRTPDAESVDELLRQGQYVDVIARVKQVSEDEVYAAAARLGILAPLRPNLTGNLAADADASASESGAAVEQSTPEPRPAVTDVDQRVGPSLDERIIELYREGMGAPEIKEALADSNVNVNVQKISAVIREHRKQSTSDAAPASE